MCTQQVRKAWNCWFDCFLNWSDRINNLFQIKSISKKYCTIYYNWFNLKHLLQKNRFHFYRCFLKDFSILNIRQFSTVTIMLLNSKNSLVVHNPKTKFLRILKASLFWIIFMNKSHKFLVNSYLLILIHWLFSRYFFLLRSNLNFEWEWESHSIIHPYLLNSEQLINWLGRNMLWKEVLLL